MCSLRNPIIQTVELSSKKNNHFKANKEESDLIFSMGKLLFLLQFCHSKQSENLKKFERKRKQNCRSNKLPRWLTFLSNFMKAIKIVENVYCVILF